MNDSWDRRRFLKRLGLAGAGACGSTAVGLWARQRDRGLAESSPEVVRIPDFSKEIGDGPDGVAIGAGTPAEATTQAVLALGGMKRFVKPGDKVAIKPNIAWDRTPLQAANTHPLVVAELVRLCLDAGAAEVVVTDNTCNEARRCFTRSGIWKATEAAGGKIILPEEHRFAERTLGGVLRTIPVLLPAIEADRFINVAIAKHHSLAKFTGAMKNLYGVIGGRRNRHHQRIDASVADLANAIRATLTVVDATRVLLRNGPQGGDISDTKPVGKVLASTDPVAVDAVACTFIGLTPEALPYLAMGERLGLGRIVAPILSGQKEA